MIPGTLHALLAQRINNAVPAILCCPEMVRCQSPAAREGRGAATLVTSLGEENFMFKVRNLALAVAGSALAFPALAQTTLTFSTWVPPTHHLSVWQRNWASAAH